MSRIIKICRRVWLQTAIWLAYGVLSLLQYLGFAASSDEVADRLLNQLASHRLFWTVGASFIENIIGASLYFPGSIIVLTAMAQTSGSAWAAINTYFAIYLPAVVAQHCNFFIGRLTGKLSEMVPSPSKRLWTVCLATFWHPQLAAVTCYSLGSRQRLNYRQFIGPFLCSSLIWSVFWAVVIYNFGRPFATPRVFGWIVVIYLGIWTLQSIRTAIHAVKR